jgi:prepilin-type N-terminal cleavage/methylation domain-containing protein
MKNRGYTLIELILVIVIIGILASIAVQSLKSSDDNQRFISTVDEMEMLARAVVGDERLVSGGIRTDFGYMGDVGSLPPNLDALVTNPGGYATWNGPYIRSNFVENSEDYKRDAWNNPYTYGGLTISSTGGGSSVTKQFANSNSSLISNTIYGIVRDQTGCPPWDSASNVTITIYYPDGGGSTTSSSTSPARSGEFSIENSIPIGLHLIRAVVTGVDDTTAKYVAVNPGSDVYSELRFPSNLWGGTIGAIEYVSGSANTSPIGDMVELQVENTGSSPVTVTSMTIEYSSLPTAYYNKVIWGGNTVWNKQNPRNGSGDAATFSPSKILNASEVIQMEIETWKDCPSGNCADYDIHGTAFTITFSNGDVITFSAP